MHIILVTLFLINAVLYLTLLIRNLFRDKVGKYIKVYRLEIAFLGISLIQYIMNIIVENSPYAKEYDTLIMIQFRFVCALLTSPLVMYSYYQIAKDDGYEGNFGILLISVFGLIFTTLIMNYANHNPLYKKIVFAIACGFYGIIIWRVIEIMKFFKNLNSESGDGKFNLGWFLIFGWLLYTLTILIDRKNPLKFVIYSIGDFITKGLYSFAVNTALSK
jgi:hypothetical protein